MDVANVSDAVERDLNVAFAKASFAEIFALNKFGMAIAANRAMMATTIMISTSVKPLIRLVLFIWYSIISSAQEIEQ